MRELTGLVEDRDVVDPFVDRLMARLGERHPDLRPEDVVILVEVRASGPVMDPLGRPPSRRAWRRASTPGLPDDVGPTMLQWTSMSYDRVLESVDRELRERGQDRLEVYVVTETKTRRVVGVFLTRKRAETFVGPSTWFYSTEPQLLVTG